MVKKDLFLFVMLFAFLSASHAQEQTPRAQKPVIMVVPEKAWCINQGFVSDTDAKIPDYGKALLNDDVLNVITKMGGIMEERGYPLKLLSAAIDELNTEAAMDLALTSKDGGEIVEDDLDKLTRVAGADILVQIAFTRTNYGPRKIVEFRITSVDAATSKQIGGETGRSSASNAPIGDLLRESVLSFMDIFANSIQRHFDNVVRNGREGSIIFKIADDCPMNFESEVTLNGESGELSEAIDYWLGENSIDGAFSQGAKSRVRLVYEQVRFPLFGKAKFGGKAKAINAEGFVKPISQFLSQFGLSVSTQPVGIGKVYVIIGGK